MYYHSIRYKSDAFAVRCSALLLQILRYAQKDIPCHHRRSRCVVILNEAAGEVKDLECHSGSLLRLPHQILR